MESFRVKRYNITELGVIENRLIQGAFRYEKLNLSTAGELQLRHVGVRQTVHTTPLSELPGSFECSDEDLTRIWRTGARTAQLTEIPKNTIPNFWNVTPEGSFVESATPQALAVGPASQLTGYEIDFKVKPITGEFVFSLFLDTIGDGIRIHCNVVNGLVSTSTGDKGYIPLSAGAQINKWLNVHARVNMTEIFVSVNYKTVIEFSQTDKSFGSFGLGAWAGHSAYYRDLTATTLEGDEVYSNSLTNPDFLDDFLMGNNPLDTIVDGSRRDRIAFAGDLDISIGVTYASTFAKSFVEGSIELLGSFQAILGFYIPNAKIQQRPSEDLLPTNITGLIGYSFNLINGMFTHHNVIGDMEFARKWAPSVQSMLDWADSQVVDGLFTIHDAAFTGDWNYYDPPQTGASSKFNVLYAYALQQSQQLLGDAGLDTEVYHNRLWELRKAINRDLWSTELGAYMVSDNITTGFAQDAQALAILAGVPQSANISAKSIFNTMTQALQLDAGPLAFSPGTQQAGFARKISPFASAYHLRAAFEAGDADTVLLLLKSLWAPMANPAHANYTNTFWETLNPDGTPGLGLPTSLCHGWAAGPIAELSQHVLGVKAIEPGFAAWQVKPLTLGLDWARGEVPTKNGNIAVEWSFEGHENDYLQMTVRSPQEGSSVGTVQLPQPLRVPLDDTVIKVNGKVVPGSSFSVAPGEELQIRQEAR